MRQEHQNEKRVPEKLENFSFISDGKIKCNECTEIIKPVFYKSHEEQCKLYFKFCEETSEGVRCLLCLKEYTKKATAYTHIKEKHSNFEGLKCQFCSIENSDSNQLLKHMNDKHKNESQSVNNINLNLGLRLSIQRRW